MERHLATIPSDAEAVISLVKRAAAEECAPDGCRVFPSLDACARDAVNGLRGSRIKTFVPLLALRRVRSCIRVGSCDTTAW